MISLVQHIIESSIERYSLKVTLGTFIKKSIESARFPMSKYKSVLIDSLNKYSDGGPKIEDWIDNSQSKEITFTTYIESVSGKERYTIEVQDPSYDMMKMCFDKNDSIGENVYEYVKNNGRKL